MRCLHLKYAKNKGHSCKARALYDLMGLGLEVSGVMTSGMRVEMVGASKTVLANHFNLLSLN